MLGSVSGVQVEEVFQTEQPTFLLRLGGNLIRTKAEHPFYIPGKGWIKEIASNVRARTSRKNMRSRLANDLIRSRFSKMVYQRADDSVSLCACPWSRW